MRLLRHGEVHNPDQILYGRLPGFGLSERGQRQALTVAEAVSGHDIVHVAASPLQRAQQTATPITAAHRLDIVTDDRLIEAGNQFEGKRVAVGDGVLWQPRQWSKLTDPFTPSWGEPYLKIAHRMLGAVYRARTAAVGHEALCVSHQLPIWTLRRFLSGKRLWHDPRKRQCALASLTSLVFEDEELTAIEYSEPAGALDSPVVGA